MKKLDTSPIAPGNAFPVKGGTLLFLQLAYQEAFAVLMQANIGSTYDPTKGYILYGCINTGYGSNYSISAGAIFFNGEIFLVNATSFTLTGSNVAEAVIGTTQYTADADPVLFTGGSSMNVHNIRQIVFQNGLAGSGAFDFVNAVNLAYRPVGAIGQTVIWTPPSGVVSDYFNVTTGNSNSSLTSGWIITNQGLSVFGYKNGDDLFGTIGDSIAGEVNHLLTVSEMPSHKHTQNRVAAGGSGGSSNQIAVNQGNDGANADVDSINLTGGAQTHNNMPPFTVDLMIKRIN